jgi:hypothetical protein
VVLGLHFIGPRCASDNLEQRSDVQNLELEKPDHGIPSVAFQIRFLPASINFQLN